MVDAGSAKTLEGEKQSKPRFQLSRVPAIAHESRLHPIFLFGTIAQETRV